MQNFVKLQFSNNRPDVEGLDNVNDVLRANGVRVTTVSIPEEAKSITAAALRRPTTEQEQARLIELFHLNRRDLLEQIELAGREPEVRRGGHLDTQEGDTAPYPKVYDNIAHTEETLAWTLNRYGRLHVNASDSGVGLDEVMTVVAGGPYTWMFVLIDGVIARLTVAEIDAEGPAIRLSYPGLGMHAGYMDAERGLIVAFAHGPKTFNMLFEESSVNYSHLLNTNPWVNFSERMPKLRDSVQ